MKNRTRILIFSLAYSPFVGGAEIAIQEITKRLGDSFSFDLITCNLDGKQKEKEEMKNLTIYRVKSKYLFPWVAFRKARELYKQNKYNIVWGMMASWGGWAALKFKEKFSNVKYLLTLQSGDSDSFIKKRTWFWSLRYKKIYQKADYIQVISKWLADRARRFGYKGEIDVVPNGVTINSKQLTLQSGGQAVNNKNKKIILTVSRLVEKNGIEDLIQGFKLLITNYSSSAKATADRQLPVTLRIIGDGLLKNKLQNLTKKLGIQDKVEFIGSVKYENLPEYYAQADVFVRPSLSEGFGSVFIEAMAVNVPVIATPVGGIPDFFKEGETGWFCQVKNSQSIAEKIQYILDDKNKSEVNRVVMNAKKMVEEKYTWDKVVGQMQKIFQKLLK